jgi:hypothetical protein
MIKLIEDFCFNYTEPFSINHERFKADFTNFLQKESCSVIEEYELIFNNVKANGEIVRQRGFIDFLVYFDNKKIAIEFDNGNRLKLKSIAKLLQSGADLMIGIVRGNPTYNVQFSNRKRMKWVMKKLQNFRRILLIVIAPNSYCWI